MAAVNNSENGQKCTYQTPWTGLLTNIVKIFVGFVFFYRTMTICCLKRPNFRIKESFIQKYFLTEQVSKSPRRINSDFCKPGDGGRKNQPGHRFIEIYIDLLIYCGRRVSWNFFVQPPLTWQVKPIAGML
jgi:hypothetical protein